MGQENSIGNLLIVPGGQTHVNLARTPGSETTMAKGRNRKCSIVQEDNEDDEDEVGSGREELNSPLNRRGSRSEGRINLAVQDRLAAETVMKKESKVIGKYEADEKSDLIDGLAGIKIIKDTPKEKYLGLAGAGLQQNRNKERVLTDSSTINIVPIPAINIVSNQLPKFKTMPSPTRPTAILAGTNCLKDIFEEATDAGSSDTSNTTTPRPLIRSENCPPNQHTRRTKFHKTRNASCSSSDASDQEETESRKKRATKIFQAGETKPITQYRRDSHDDSSDSQEQGNCKGAGGGQAAGANGTLIIRCSKTGGQNGSSGTGHTTSPNSSQNEKNRKNNCTKSSSGGDLCYRRAGRRRPVETRLRESQSLNRITEVQEVQEAPIVGNRLSPFPNRDKEEPPDPDLEPEDDPGDPGEDDEEEEERKVIETKTDVVIVIGDLKEEAQPSNRSNSPINQKHPNKSFSARLFQNFKKSSSRQQKAQIVPTISVTLNNNNGEMVPEAAVLTDLDRKGGNLRNSSNGATKKIKILGKYFQVS